MRPLLGSHSEKSDASRVSISDFLVDVRLQHQFMLALVIGVAEGGFGGSEEPPPLGGSNRARNAGQSFLPRTFLYTCVCI